jgi:hypothetical protein
LALLFSTRSAIPARREDAECIDSDVDRLRIATGTVEMGGALANQLEVENDSRVRVMAFTGRI